MARYLPHGTTFSVNSQLVGGLTSISIPDRSRGEAEITDSNSAFDREYLPGLREGGSVELTFRHNPDDVGQGELETNFNTNGDSAIVSCVLTLPDASLAGGGSRKYTFQGFVTAPPNGDLNLADDEAAELSATIKVADAAVVVGS
jgi:hypothetical protein